MGVIFGGLLTAPSAPPVNWTGMSMRWIGWDGSEWSLTDASTGTVMLPGVRGLSMPPIIHHRAAHASQPGARWRGHTVDVREVFWPVQIYSDAGSTEWIERDRAFWKTLDPSRTGQWIVDLPDGSTRTLDLRYASDSDYVQDHDSVLAGWNNYGITLAAEQPYWQGPAITRQWEAGTSTPFFSGTGGPSFAISPSNTLSTATLENPGDVPVYPVWRIEGPVSSATVGVNGKTISIPFAIAAGDVLEIDTSPAVQAAYMGPVAGPLTVDKTMNLSSIYFASLPPGEPSTLTLALSGTGKVSATFRPLYYRAW